jgi:N-acetylmuramoyl-L-alanine amidase
MRSAEDAIQRLCDPAPPTGRPVSAHYVVEEDGAIHALVPEDRRAWHAGISHWRGREALNDCSIGVEIVNPGHEFGYRDFPDAQMAAVLDLCRDILGRHDIPARNVVAHSDIAPDRKQDPGEKFAWRLLAEAGIGLWPTADATEVDDVASALTAIGYRPDLDQPCLLRAFQRHWLPESVTGTADLATRRRLAAVLQDL